MAMTINTNIQSLNAQRNLGTSQSSLSTSMQRLSSGLRINSAKDDAAGLAIAERMSAQVRGLNQAQRNANDGVSLAQTAEGALGTIGGNLQRIRELAVQSRNATNSEEDRAALQKEVGQLKDEIDRVANNTEFNGVKLLNGSFTGQEFQVGANQGQTISIDKITNANIDSLGTWTPVDKAGQSNRVGLDATAELTVKQGEKVTMSLTVGSAKAEVVIDNTKGNADLALSKDELAKKLDAQLAKTAMQEGVSYTGSMAKGNLTFSNATDTDVTFALSSEATLAAGGAGTSDTAKLKLAETDTNGAAVGTPSGKAAAQTKLTETSGFKDLDISSIEGADNAIKAMDAALTEVNSARANLGAIQNRFESVVANLSVNSENLSASKSRIMDADFASETANLSRSQILQQAGTAMVAQANQLPQGVLSLLR